MNIELIKNIIISYGPAVAAVGSAVLTFIKTVKAVKNETQTVTASLTNKIYAQDKQLLNVRNLVEQNNVDFCDLLQKVNKSIEYLENSEKTLENSLKVKIKAIDEIEIKYEEQIKALMELSEKLLEENKRIRIENEKLIEELKTIR